MLPRFGASEVDDNSVPETGLRAEVERKRFRPQLAARARISFWLAAKCSELSWGDYNMGRVVPSRTAGDLFNPSARRESVHRPDLCCVLLATERRSWVKGSLLGLPPFTYCLPGRRHDHVGHSGIGVSLPSKHSWARLFSLTGLDPKLRQPDTPGR